MKFALVGNPNCGKTTLFNKLTGSSAKIGNWPGVTVDRKEGILKIGSETVSIIDLPGIYSLSPYSPEEIIARNYILEEKPDLIINIIDSTNLERNLYLTTQLLETDANIIIALNMTDLINKNGIFIDKYVLANLIGIPVVEISALKNIGFDEMINVGLETAKSRRKASSIIYYSRLNREYEMIVNLLKNKNIYNVLFRAGKILEGERDLSILTKNEILQIDKIISTIKPRFYPQCSFDEYVADLRYSHITEGYIKAAVHKRDIQNIKAYKLDVLITSRFFGIPFFLFIMFIVFHLTFSKNLFFITGMPSPPLLFSMYLEDLFSQITGFAANQLIAFNENSILYGIVIKALFTGVGGVICFLPLVLTLYLFFCIMEDSGYLARVAFLMDGIVRKLGISGRAILPLIMGFGCTVPAISATKALRCEKEKKITIMMTTGFSCGAKLPVWTIFAAALFPKCADLVVFAVYAGGVIIMCVMGFIVNKFFMIGDEPSFIMELPPYRIPNPYNLIILLRQKLKDFIYRALTIIFASTVAIWFFSNYDFSLHKVTENSADSMLGTVGIIIRPLFAPLGFAANPVHGWKSIAAALTGLIAKEMIVASSAVLYAGASNALNGSETLISTLPQYFTPLTGLSFMFFNLLCSPCIAAITTAFDELKSLKQTIITLGFWFITAYMVSFIIYQAGTLLGFN